AVHWIDNEKLWLEMMSDRNMTSHIYKHEMALQIYRNIEKYYPEMKNTYGKLIKLFGKSL
ncbi:nucleotidyltransferase substrate binding protein, partial [Candidatus Babeliales bacterium]|nr:nucleotidyltransferase substrate binding protein [Candidatus Babeliales bacterium]